MESTLKSAFDDLSEVQRTAVAWQDGAILVLAGPGSGKTQVLTCRIACLLDAGRDKSFRVLALTFTNKAADEMKGRVSSFVPGLEERATIGTFHSFCGQILRQHGVHLGIKPDFTIYALDADRRAVLSDALELAVRSDSQFSPEDVRFLPTIDRLKTLLIEPNDAVKALGTAQNADRIVRVYQLYENELRRLNALDFNSLILEAYKLASKFPALAGRYRVTHPYWLLDEFQDTNSAQYRFLKALAGPFRNIFAVADDDQIIYQWNGASFRHIQAFQADYEANVIQLPTNYRCPPAIVEAANKLVAYNAQRTTAKKPLVAAKTKLKLPAADHIRLIEFDDDESEAAGVAAEIVNLGKTQWSSTTVLARTRALLERMHSALQAQGVPAYVAQRRDDFLSPELRWLVASLAQLIRPLDRRNLSRLIDAYNRIGEFDITTDEIFAASEASGEGYLSSWLSAVAMRSAQPPYGAALAALKRCVADPSVLRTLIEEATNQFAVATGQEAASDLEEDLQAWRQLRADIGRHIGQHAPIDQFLQELQLRSKEPAPKLNAVVLMTVHASKGREFDYVYLIGLAEDIMPAFQSRQKGDKSPEMEEERRNCFVAITRTKECLILSRALRYRGWAKQPSRFLVEMGFVA